MAGGRAARARALTRPAQDDIREGNIKRIPDAVLMELSEDSLEVIEHLLHNDPLQQVRRAGPGPRG